MNPVIKCTSSQHLYAVTGVYTYTHVALKLHLCDSVISLLAAGPDDIASVNVKFPGLLFFSISVGISTSVFAE